jgi:hypothetical protein
VNTDQLIDTITQEVLRSLGRDPAAPGDSCADCTGGCAGSCSDKVRRFVGTGTGRVGYTGDGADVPSDLAG